MKKTVALSLLFGCLIAAGPCRAADDCPHGRDLFQRAMSQTVVDLRIELLNFSLQACPSYDAFYQLGRALGQTGRFEQAVPPLVEAVRMAETDLEAAQALALLGQLYEARGRYHAALVALRRSDRKRRIEAVHRQLKALERRMAPQVMPADDIKRALSPANQRLGLDPEVTLHFHFEPGTADLTPHGLQQALQLGLALDDADFQGRNFELIGHTGAEEPPREQTELSRRQAAAVDDYITPKFEFPPDRIQVRGAGAAEPMIDPADPSMAGLNQRIVVRVQPRP